MSEGHRSISGQVVIVGGGVAGLEALIALRALVGNRVTVTLVSQDDWFVDRPLTVTEPQTEPERQPRVALAPPGRARDRRRGPGR
jgi:NADH dehydrogenase FAD-containing subunit